MLFINPQIDRLQLIDERLHQQYTKLVSRTEICSEDVELVLLPDTNQPDEVHLLIRIAMDFSVLPGRHTVLSNDAAMLLVTFQGPTWNRITPTLYFSKNLEETFGSSSIQHLPSFPKDKMLMDYVHEVKKFISDKIKLITTNFEKKMGFIMAVACHQPAAVIEYDAIDYNYIVIILTHKDFDFLVSFNLSSTFPADQPKVTLQSIYHMSSKTQVYKHVLVDHIPYSPRWTPTAMVTRAFEHIMTKEIHKFRSISMQKRR